MKIKFFTFPIHELSRFEEELNIFLLSHRILHVQSELVNMDQHPYWCFCIRYLDDEYSPRPEKNKIDYKEVLDTESFERLTGLREIRKKVAEIENLKLYQVFTNEELAEMAKCPILTVTEMKKIKGIGEKKIEKFASYFIANEKSEGLTTTDH